MVFKAPLSFFLRALTFDSAAVVFATRTKHCAVYTELHPHALTYSRAILYEASRPTGSIAFSG